MIHYLSEKEPLLSLQIEGNLRDLYPFQIIHSTSIQVEARPSWECVYFEWRLLDDSGDTWRVRLKTSSKPKNAFPLLKFSLQIEENVDIRVHFTENGKEVGSTEWFRGKGRREEYTCQRPDLNYDSMDLEIRGGSRQENYFLGFHWIALSGKLRDVPAYHGVMSSLDSVLLADRKLSDASPKLGLLFGEADLQSLRKKRRSPDWKNLYAQLQRTAWEASKKQPLSKIQSYTPWGDDRFSRPFERNRDPLYHQALTAGLVGILENDEDLCRAAVEHLAAMLLTPNWKASGECDIHGSSWDMRCFIEEQVVTATVILLDWFETSLQPGFVEFARRKIYDQGIAVIERDLAKCEYVHHMNQGIWFSRGRILGLLWLETQWPRLRPQTDRAMEVCQEILSTYIQSDGSVHEGMGYYGLTLEMACIAAYAYARRRGLSIKDLLPENILDSENYLSALSLSTPGHFHTIGDNADSQLYSDAIPLLAKLFPSSIFKDLAPSVAQPPRRYTYFQHYVGHGVYSFIWGSHELGQGSTLSRESVSLPDLGLSQISRVAPAQPELRAWLLGKGRLRTHRHDDAGSILLEVGGQTALTDRGVDRYEYIHNNRLSRTCRHNCLTPTTDTRFHANQASTDEPCPVIAENSRMLSVKLATQWADLFHTYQRKISLANKGELVLEDSGQINTQSVLTVHFHTPFSVKQHGEFLILERRNIRLKVFAEWAQSIEIEQDELWTEEGPVTWIRLSSAPVKRFQLMTCLSIL